MAQEKKIRFEQISFLAALCMFLSAVEYAIPKPFPFLRLGLANLPIIISLKKFSLKEILVLLGLKILGQALISGTLFSYVFLFSVFGSISSCLMMIIFFRFLFKYYIISNIGVSLAGAFANCCAQLLCAKYLMFGNSVKFVAPVLFCSSMVTGLLLGVFANVFENKSSWYGNFCGKAFKISLTNDCKYNKIHRISTDEKNKNRTVEFLWKNSVFWIVLSCFAMVILMFCESILTEISIVQVFLVLNIIKRGKINIIPSLVMVFILTFFSLMNPFGEVLFSIGNWKITLGALVSGLQHSLRLVGMVFISKFVINKNVRLPGKMGLVINYVFSVFDKLTAEKIRFSKSNIVKTIDEKLIAITEDRNE